MTLMPTLPAVFLKDGASKEATTAEEYWQLVWDGWTLSTAPPLPRRLFSPEQEAALAESIAAAETARDEAAAFGGTNNEQVAGMVTGEGPTKVALSATIATEAASKATQTTVEAGRLSEAAVESAIFTETLPALRSFNPIETNDALTGATVTLDGSALSGGYTWKVLSGTWSREAGGVKETTSGTTAQHKVAVIEMGTADVQVSVRTKPAATASNGRNRLALRVVNTTTLLVVAPQSNGLVFQRIQGGVITDLYTDTRYKTLNAARADIEVIAVGRRIAVLYNGVHAFTYELTETDWRTFGAATRHGLATRATTSAGMFSNFRIRHAAVSERLLYTATDAGDLTVYWTRPLANPATTGSADAFVWVGSTDHGNGYCYRGYSANQSTPPTTWVKFLPPQGTGRETPFLVYDSTEAKPWRLYYSGAISGDGQKTMLASYPTIADMVTDSANVTNHGIVLPGTAAGGGINLDHTGYLFVERRSATDWHGWSLTSGSVPPKMGYWTSADGEAWTSVNYNVDLTSMVPAGRALELTNFSRFAVAGINYAIMTEGDVNGHAGGSAAVGRKVVLCTMSTEQTFTVVDYLWDPVTHGLADNLRNVTAVVDATDAGLVHVYIHNDTTRVYYRALRLN